MPLRIGIVPHFAYTRMSLTWAWCHLAAVPATQKRASGLATVRLAKPRYGQNKLNAFVPNFAQRREMAHKTLPLFKFTQTTRFRSIARKEKLYLPKMASRHCVHKPVRASGWTQTVNHHPAQELPVTTRHYKNEHIHMRIQHESMLP